MIWRNCKNMEIKIIKDGLKNKDGGPLHTYEYNLKDKEIIDVYHLRPGETIVWETATKENMMTLENKEKQKYNGPSFTPWLDMEIEAFIICEVDMHVRKLLYLISDMIEVQEIEFYPSQRNWIFPVEIENGEEVDFTSFLYQEVIIEAREELEQKERPVRWNIKKIMGASEYPVQSALTRNRERDIEDAERFANQLFQEKRYTEQDT